ncbi:MAG: hypothetical protein AB4290_10535 [Spirulina sp.]
MSYTAIVNRWVIDYQNGAIEMNGENQMKLLYDLGLQEFSSTDL